MYILDTDHLSILDRADTHEAQRLRFRLAQVPPNERVTTIISFEEQMRGWMAVVAKARTLPEQVASYGKLNRFLNRYRNLEVAGFDDQAAAEFQRLQSQMLRIGTMDLKIAAIALSLNATLLSRNLLDFQRVPGLKVEDWSA
jgi:tRNA(fMet)-specific endonuclease VapC